ncbi:MAG: aldo/keto reductase [Methanobacteriota archaeon]|nr:MAG: aldo/keto reductase [Euryarchaeota archaeon]
MGLSINSRIKLNNGVEMPIFGLGVWQIPAGAPTQRAVKAALQVGYRLIDTAKFYGNEADVGIAVRGSGLPRDEVFITTKVWNDDHGYETALKAFEASRKRLGFSTVDLYLIHWPVPGLRKETWKALEKIQKEGKAHAIGVSNYMVPHLEELLASAEVVPAVNQIELSPFLVPKDVIEFCKKHAIAVEAYSPLTKGHRINDPRLKAVAQKYGKTVPQILIRWGLQHGFIEIPKSSRPEHIKENAQVFDFEIRAEDMRALDSLGEGLHVAWDPTDEP